MLPENVNWNAVLQSITDTWFPLIGMVAAIILVAIIVHVAQKKVNWKLKFQSIHHQTGT